MVRVLRTNAPGLTQCWLGGTGNKQTRGSYKEWDRQRGGNEDRKKRKKEGKKERPKEKKEGRQERKTMNKRTKDRKLPGWFFREFFLFFVFLPCPSWMEVQVGTINFLLRGLHTSRGVLYMMSSVASDCYLCLGSVLRPTVKQFTCALPTPLLPLMIRTTNHWTWWSTTVAVVFRSYPCKVSPKKWILNWFGDVCLQDMLSSTKDTREGSHLGTTSGPRLSKQLKPSKKSSN